MNIYEAMLEYQKGREIFRESTNIVYTDGYDLKYQDLIATDWKLVNPVVYKREGMTIIGAMQAWQNGNLIKRKNWRTPYNSTMPLTETDILATDWVIHHEKPAYKTFKEKAAKEDMTQYDEKQLFVIGWEAALEFYKIGELKP